MCKDKKDSIQKYLKEKSKELDSPGMSAVFSALKDVDGIEKAMKPKSHKEKKEAKTGIHSPKKTESSTKSFLRLMNANASNAYTGKAINTPVLA